MKKKLKELKELLDKPALRQDYHIQNLCHHLIIYLNLKNINITLKKILT